MRWGGREGDECVRATMTGHPESIHSTTGSFCPIHLYITPGNGKCKGAQSDHELALLWCPYSNVVVVWGDPYATITLRHCCD